MKTEPQLGKEALNEEGSSEHKEERVLDAICMFPRLGRSSFPTLSGRELGILMSQWNCRTSSRRL